MTRRRVLILAAAVALLLLAVDVRSLFAAHSLHRLVAWLWALCSRLTEPLPMALVTLGAALAMPRDDARLPVVVNLAAALLMGAALSWGNKPHFLGGLLRLTPEAAGAMSSICFYAFLLWAARRYCAPGPLRAGLTALLAVVLASAVRALPDGPRFLSSALAAAAVTGTYLWLLTGFARRRAAGATA